VKKRKKSDQKIQVRQREAIKKPAVAKEFPKLEVSAGLR
jgi:hypothetical protein